VSELDDVRADLVAEQRSLDDLVANLSEAQWSLATPSPGWNITDQIGHLAFFDAAATEAILDPDAFRAGVQDLYEGAVGVGVDEYTLGDFRKLTPARRLETWRQGRAALASAAATLHDDTRVAWYGPSMGAKSFLTARLMEAWAHGADVADALGVRRRPTDRLRHIAQLGFITRKWSYTVRGEKPPAGEIRLELLSPSGHLWVWGPENAPEIVQGSAEEFCLVVTQRRHVDDTSLRTGELGRHWLVRAQAFAGGPTTGPQPKGS
jgi:uncharacterized protein (TIGR03084 family)